MTEAMEIDGRPLKRLRLQEDLENVSSSFKRMRLQENIESISIGEHLSY